MVKNTKKRLSSESEVGVKIKEESVVKKKKSENGAAQNGQANKQVKKDSQKVKLDKDVNRKAYREKRKALRLEKKQHGVKPDISADEIKRKVEEIEKRGQLTKTAKRKLATLKKLLRVKEGTDKPKQQVAKKQGKKGKNQKQVEDESKKQVQTNAEQKKKVLEKGEIKPTKDNKKKDKQGSLLLVKPEESDDEDDEDDNEEDIDFDDNASDDDEDVEEEEEDLDEEEGEDEDDEDEEEDEDDDEDDDEDEDDEEDEEETKVIQTPQLKEKPKQNPEQDGKKKRFVLFVGNLPFSVTEEEVKKHFLTKASQIVDIRIPKNNDNKPRGFAYVELANQTDYEKALALNNTFVNGRRIKVQYSGSNKKETVAKNQKLQALQKAGKLGSGQKKNFQKKNTGFKGQKMKT